MAVIFYTFREKDGITLLTGKEELTKPLDKTAFDDALAGWVSALKSVKEMAEKL